MQITIEPATDADGPDIYRIADESGLPKAWNWPEGLPGTVARYEGRVVAFCILKESIYGLVIEELWRENTRYGVKGIFALGDWIESTARRLAHDRGTPLAVGGIIRNELSAHNALLEKRGFVDIAHVKEKVFYP